MMSVVCNVVCAAATWIACDGRASKDGEIISEHVQKFRALNKDVIVGFTGVLETAEQVLDHISNRCGDAIIKNLNSDTFAELLSSVLEKSTIELNGRTNFLVTGKTRSGEIASFVVEQSGNVTSHKLLSESQIITIAIGDLQQEISLNDYLRHEIENGVLTREAVVSCMKKYISSIADVSGSVNKNIIIAEILR